MSEALTAAEMQVLRLICADKSNAEIGEILGLPLGTVHTRLARGRAKLREFLEEGEEWSSCEDIGRRWNVFAFPRRKSGRWSFV